MFIDYLKKGKNSDYLEFQVCRLSVSNKLSLILSINNINLNLETSLYLDFKNYDLFIKNYGSYFNDAIHENLKEDNFDLYGINYYSIDKTIEIIEKIKNDKPLEYNKIIDFLIDAKNNNGFYIFGI